MARKKAKPEAAEQPPPELSRFQRFEAREIPRASLKNAPYNPRVVSDHQRRKLKAILKKHGLVEPPVWNETSGNLVGGHLRTKILDALHGDQNYLLTVAVVRLDDKAERELNVALNNPLAQGDYDFEALAKLFKEDRIEAEGAGFDSADLYQMYGEDILSDNAEQLQEMAKTLESLRADSERVKKSLSSHHSPDFYNVVVFPDLDARQACADLLDVPDNRYLSGETLLDALRDLQGLRLENARLKAAMTHAGLPIPESSSELYDGEEQDAQQQEERARPDAEAGA